MERFWLNNNGFRKKMSEVHKGKKHHNWRGGITPINQQIRHSFEANEWRTMVFGRDGFACQMCFRKGGYLNAHHIKPFAKYPELRFEIDNGITLCEECHNKTKWKEEEFAPMLETLVLNQKNRGGMKW
jgi:5-methylcytosine-specific restriction endonuclease McrA